MISTSHPWNSLTQWRDFRETYRSCLHRRKKYAYTLIEVCLWPRESTKMSTLMKASKWKSATHYYNVQNGTVFSRGIRQRSSQSQERGCKLPRWCMVCQCSPEPSRKRAIYYQRTVLTIIGGWRWQPRNPWKAFADTFVSVAACRNRASEWRRHSHPSSSCVPKQKLSAGLDIWRSSSTLKHGCGSTHEVQKELLSNRKAGEESAKKTPPWHLLSFRTTLHHEYRKLMWLEQNEVVSSHKWSMF